MFHTNELLIILFDTVVVLFCTRYRVLMSKGKDSTSHCQQNKVHVLL